MLERFFHAWENRLASVTTDRVVRPFEWGVDWLPNKDDGRPPDQQVSEWVSEVMQDSTRFFDVPPTTNYQFSATDTSRSQYGEAGTLSFPTALPTPHAQNNVVTARWFPATRHREHSRAVLVLPQWNSKAHGHIGLSRLLAKLGISALRLSLPYHDDRMPSELTRADYIVSSNVVRTVQVCRQAVLDARRAIAWLADQGFERIGILGTSLGSCLALLTTAHEPLVKVQALNHVSPWFADVVWRGLSTRHVRQGLQSHIDLNMLREMWQPISPWSYLDRVKDVRTLLVYGRYDLTFPVDLSEHLVKEFSRRDIPHEVAILPCGHYTTERFPFKHLDGYVLTKFLYQNL